MCCSSGRFTGLLFAILLLKSPMPVTGAPAPDFNRDIAPILAKRCMECHSGSEPSGKLDLATQAGLLRGGEDGLVFERANPNQSRLLQRVEGGEMPPSKQGKSKKLPRAEIDLIRSWLVAGADWPAGRIIDPFETSTELRAGRDWWSLQEIRRPKVPGTIASGSGENPVDAFVLEKLEAKGWKMAPPADKRSLMRRAYYDLIGLPPTAGEISAFVSDPSPKAYESMVDRLLASPQFGERWGRYWLDIARYAETCGYERDQVKPAVWKYRDWVIRAVNEDMPYDQFIVAQLAGDELPGRTEESLVATGFLRLGTWNDEPNDPEEYKYERLEDMVHATSTAFLGLTVKCARCHDHKFDPISQADYYRMASAFWAGYVQPGQGVLGGPDPKSLGADVLAWTDVSATPPPLLLLHKGDPKRPGPPVEPAAMSFLPQLNRLVIPPPQGAATTQRRRQLAQWIAEPKNPLTARVWVNRLWQFHFGKGLVRSPDNFGFTGDKPTHPGLLDWLADEFTAGGWRSKRMHKLLMMSRAYRQASTHPEHERYSQQDFANQLWWRAERRRLDADALRDSLLAVSGKLDLHQAGGPSFAPVISPEALEGLSMKGQAWKASPSGEQGRRSVYMFTKRSLLSPMATVFDFPDTTLPCGQRDVTVVAPQALALLNNAMVHEQSGAVARSVLASSPAKDPRDRITRAWQLVLGRSPTASEVESAASHLQRQRDHFVKSAGMSASPSDAGQLHHGLRLHLDAESGIDLDTAQGVVAWRDQSSTARHHASQPDAAWRPKLVRSAWNQRAVLQFDGQNDFLRMEGQVLDAQEFTLVAVASDEGGSGHREIFSNWNGQASNAVTSVFLGTTGRSSVRFTDDYPGAGELRTPAKPWVIAAVSRPGEAAVYQNGALLGKKSSALARRNLGTEYVVGTQGNINGEFWRGGIAEIMVYNRALNDTEIEEISERMAVKYGIQQTAHDPDLLALASLCHVLLNTNEFIYVD